MKLQMFLIAFLIVISSSLAGQQGLSVGDNAPEFKATADDGSTWDINKFLGNKYIVVYFYPAAMTAGCTKQACSYRDHKEDLQLAGIEVVGVSGDKIENLRLFKQAEKLNFTLLSDEKGNIAEAFGVPLSDGGIITRTFGGAEHELSRGVTAKRWTFIIGKDKKIIYKNEAVNAEKDSEEILNFIRLISAPLSQQALAAMQKAARYFRDEVATRGGYLFKYKTDFSMREGEEIASPSTIWVQPPGTPAVGMAFLQAYEVTGDTLFLNGAVAAANALVWGQLASGGWDYRIDFDPVQSKRWHYRRDVENGDRITGSRRNQSTLDDNTTQSAIQLLMRVDKALKFKNAGIHGAVVYGLDALLKMQYPNGAWPQRFILPPDPLKYPVLKARYPDSWPREYTGVQYQEFYTFNDEAMPDCISTMIEAYKIYGDDRYLNSAKRCGDFIILAQMPEPQPAWAQQYNVNMEPVWARKFEPPAITSSESFGILRTLLYLYLETGEKKFLEPVPKALRWAGASLLEDKRMARFYELRTNRPLYFNAPRQYSALKEPAFPDLKDYTLIYDDTDLPNHYAFKVSGSPVAAIRSDYERILKEGREKVLAGQNRNPKVNPDRVREIIKNLDNNGRWLEKGRMQTGDPGNPYVETDVIACNTFIRNLTQLSNYIKIADQGSR